MAIQNTYEEWRAYRGAGGDGTCASCHMPGGSHEMLGTRHLDFIRATLEVKRLGDQLVLAPVGVGHHFPTGDLFRHLTVEADGVIIHRVGRRYEPRLDPETQRHAEALVEDTSLRPGEERSVPLPPGAVRVRVRYHYAQDAARAALPEASVSVTLWESS